MLRRNPSLINSLGTARNRRAISATDTNLASRIDSLAAERRPLSALAALASALLLWEERCDPGVVDEEAGPGEAGAEEEVEENPVMACQYFCLRSRGRVWANICRSKKLIGASTTVTVPLKAGIWKASSPLVTSAASTRFSSAGCSSVAKLYVRL